MNLSQINQVKSGDRYKQMLLSILREFISICDKYQLSYFCIGGTLIGAIRHQGLIPWDDDIDVAMPRADYNKFLEIMKTYQGDYDMIFVESNNHYNLPFAKLMDKKSTVLEDKNIPEILGVYIDIFPLDGTSNDTNEHHELLSSYHSSWGWLTKSSKSNSYIVNSIFGFIKRGNLRTVWRWSKLLFNRSREREGFIANLNYIERKYDYDDANYIANYSGAWGIKEFWKKEWFSGFELKSFENIQVRVPVGFDMILKQVYGNYMELPPIEKQVTHHNIDYLDLDNRMSLNAVQSAMNQLK